MATIQSTTVLAAARARLQSLQADRAAVQSLPQPSIQPLAVQTPNKMTESGQPDFPQGAGHYIPTAASTSTSPHEMIALVGAPGSGKTTSCLTFPNRIWADFDHKLPVGETAIPFWSAEFCETLCKTQPGYKSVNRRDAFKYWLKEHHKKFAEDQTFILDSWTFCIAAFNEQTRAEDERLEKANAFWFWKQLVTFAEETANTLKSMKCRVVVTFHETRERDEQDRLTGKIRPVMQGSFKDQLLGYFTDVYRQVKDPVKVGSDGKKVKVGTEYAQENGWFWQLVSDSVMDCNLNPTLGAKVRAKGLRIIPASYQSIQEIYNS